jgi:signal transduction histidine kinase
MGVVAAIKGFCKEFSKQHEVSIEFTERNVPQHLRKDISLCLFRVTQEALHNAVKYSGTNRFRVQINAIAGEVQLVVTDSGAGFDVEDAKKNRGLGLVSMQERVYLVHGKLLVESEPGKGTKLLAVVPLFGENQGSSEDGTAKEAERVKEVA